MGKKDPRLDAYIGKARPFAKPILKYLRKVVHTGCPEVEENIKWGAPWFDYKGSLCGMGSFKEHCAFVFWKGRLVVPNASDDAAGQFGRITKLEDLPNEEALLGYVRKAAELNDRNVPAPWRKKPGTRKPLPLPPDLADALKKNVKARETFENFSPSNQRDYIEWVTEAKRDETRKERLKTAVQWIAEGKPRNWKYMPAKRR